MSRLIPKEHFYLAVSGGKDSMTFLKLLSLYHNTFTVLHFNHGTVHGKDAEEFVKDFCNDNNLKFIIGKIAGSRGNQSEEEYWRNERYSFFDLIPNGKIITCHHLNDVMENWVFTSLRGIPKIIPLVRGRYIRPFLQCSRESIDKFAKRYNVEHIEDPSNSDSIHMRNYIRHELMDKLLVVNPGFAKVIKKKIVLEYENLI